MSAALVSLRPIFAHISEQKVIACEESNMSLEFTVGITEDWSNRDLIASFGFADLYTSCILSKRTIYFPFVWHFVYFD